jgi:hypothetical protein
LSLYKNVFSRDYAKITLYKSDKKQWVRYSHKMKAQGVDEKNLLTCGIKIVELFKNKGRITFVIKFSGVKKSLVVVETVRRAFPNIRSRGRWE